MLVQDIYGFDFKYNGARFVGSNTEASGSFTTLSLRFVT